MLLSEHLKGYNGLYSKTKDNVDLPWVGVDLDGTLAEYYDWRGIKIIGKPVPKMLEFVINLIRSGKTVKIFTARAKDPKAIPYIKAWLGRHNLGGLEITNEKDGNMEMLYDDRVRRVLTNKGIVLDSAPTFETEYQGISITIENDIGSTRQGTKPDGTKWQTTFFRPYGYINNTTGADGEEVDCFIGPNPYANMVFIIHQRIGGKYDEDKVIFGVEDEEQAKMLYLAHFDTQNYLGPITAMSIPDFKLQYLVDSIATTDSFLPDKWYVGNNNGIQGPFSSQYEAKANSKHAESSVWKRANYWVFGMENQYGEIVAKGSDFVKMGFTADILPGEAKQLQEEVVKRLKSYGHDPDMKTNLRLPSGKQLTISDLFWKQYPQFVEYYRDFIQHNSKYI